uniref:Uncharacterized protein n=1 Tax=Arundo donax TaxID=35708 RepID=A0A0A9B4P0_ARUDO
MVQWFTSCQCFLGISVSLRMPLLRHFSHEAAAKLKHHSLRNSADTFPNFCFLLSFRVLSESLFYVHVFHLPTFCFFFLWVPIGFCYYGFRVLKWQTIY